MILLIFGWCSCGCKSDPLELNLNFLGKQLPEVCNVCLFPCSSCGSDLPTVRSGRPPSERWSWAAATRKARSWSHCSCVLALARSCPPHLHTPDISASILSSSCSLQCMHSKHGTPPRRVHTHQRPLGSEGSHHAEEFGFHSGLCLQMFCISASRNSYLQLIFVLGTAVG